MYNALFKQLDTAPDLSVNRILDLVRLGKYNSPELLSYMDNITDYITFYNQLNSTQALAQSPTVPLMLVITKLRNQPSLRLSKYI